MAVNIFKSKYQMRLIVLLMFLCSWNRLLGQDDYLLNEDQQLDMMVHIIGEVKRPGEYRVPDRTNVLQLLSKAQGPTEFSGLSHVTITRVYHQVSSNGDSGNGRLGQSSRIIKVNLDDYLTKETGTPPLLLKPGDFVMVPRNRWSKWRSGVKVFRDVSVVFSLYFLYLRATD